MSDYIIGITGGVASGKSEISRRFEELGVVVVDADVAAREAVAPGSAGLTEVVAAFGDSVLGADGALDRGAMRKRVFADHAARLQLEAIIHPRVRQAMQAQCEAARGAYAMAAIPLLVEGGGRASYPWLDRILVVDVPTDVQRERVTKRDAVDATLAASMIAVQASREERLSIADDVIVNTGAIADLVQPVTALHRLYLRLADSDDVTKARPDASRVGRD